MSQQSIYRVALPLPVQSLDPVGDDRSLGKDVVCRLLYRNLVEIDDQFATVPGVATWRIDRDNQLIRFFLRDERFHDGRPITASDAGHSIKRAVREKRPTLSRVVGYPAWDKCIEIESPKQFVVKLRYPDFDCFLRGLSVADCSLVPDGQEQLVPTGSGPYRVKAFWENSRMVLEKFDSSFVGPDCIEFVHVPEEDIITSFEKGEIDEFNTANFAHISKGPLNGDEMPLYMPHVRAISFCRSSEVFNNRYNRIEFAALCPREKIHQAVYPSLVPSYSTIPIGLLGTRLARFPQVSAESWRASRRRRVVLGTVVKDEAEAIRPFFRTDAFQERGWDVDVVFFPSIPERDDAALRGEIDGRIGNIHSKFYDPISLLEIFTSECLARFNHVVDEKYDAIFEDILTSPMEEREKKYTEADAYLIREGLVIPLVQNHVRKFVRRGAFSFRNGKRLPFFDLVGIPEDLDANLNVELNQAYSMLRQASSVIGSLDERVKDLIIHREMNRFASEVAHDIRSPLTALRVLESCLDMIPDDHRRLFQQATSRIEEIADSLLTRLHSPRAIDATPGKVAIRPLVEEVVDEKRAQFLQCYDLRIETEVEDANAIVEPVEFKRVLSNLLNNAIEAMEEKGQVNVALVRRENGVEMTVSDNGPGIPPFVLQELEAGEGTYAKPGGSGLGLSHAKRAAKKWGGTLSLASKSGNGATVTLHLQGA